MSRSVFNLDDNMNNHFKTLGYKRCYSICYELNGKKVYNSWPGPTLKLFKLYIEKVCKEFGIKHFQFVFRKRVYSYTYGNWSID